ncbi:AraC family transcriptional regulator ligand-binding domain-containing protein [Halomonas alkaliantarctica]|uniref:AraC family transcriptional regulator ligand-binding domain-containing protein n=1 Tax=Halomonas alkaliantarctica TaxID=232346 RepID=A0ABY8LJL0_9GAMM|nr:AraC family transcriptional regulator [Halomonas alkaliantarctica]WGI24036.1 AraC family transcriptional regulator ligand-binding domain-containing protein [Halomonas alkaliantarctica]
MATFQANLLNQKIYAPYKIAALLATVAEQGITADKVLRGLNLSQAALADPATLVTIKQYVDACTNVIDAGANLSTPFETATRLHLTAYGMYGYALLTSPTMRDYFDFGVKYHPLATPTLYMTWRETDESAVFEFKETYSYIKSIKTRNFLIQQQMAQNITHIRDSAGSNLYPIKALLSYSGKEVKQIHEKYLLCDCHFNQEVNEIHYPKSILEQSPLLGNQLSIKLLQKTCNQLLGRTKMSTGVAGEVYQILMMSPNSFPTMEAVADLLCITTRTLRRKLNAEMTSYRDILDDARCTLATEYLLVTKMSTEDIAARLGFSDSANFRRAFRRWTGKTPHQAREETQR